MNLAGLFFGTFFFKERFVYERKTVKGEHVKYGGKNCLKRYYKILQPSKNNTKNCKTVKYYITLFMEII